MGFIDFGIVGRIPQTIWGALQETAVGFASKDFGLMAQALVNMGAADDKVDVQAFAADLERVIVSLESIEPEVVVRGNAAGDVSAAIGVDEQQVRWDSAVSL